MNLPFESGDKLLQLDVYLNENGKDKWKQKNVTIYEIIFLNA